MILHPSVLQLSKRLGFFLPIPGIVAVITYLLTLSHGVYPGYSANLTASAAGLIPPSYETHPLFAWVARAIASWDVFSLPVRLNLFSVFCGTFCAMLFYHLISRLILFSACEDEGGGGRNALADGDMDETTKVPEMPPEVIHYNRRLLPIAVAGGLTAAFFFTFTVPVWSAATRLDNGLFDLFLALVSVSLFPTGKTFLRLPKLALSVFLCVLGTFDSAVFLLLLPCYVFFTFRAVWFSSQKNAMMGWLIAAGAVGVAFSLYVFWQNTDDLSEATLLKILISYSRELPSHHYHELLSFFPRSGWALILVQTGVPAVILLFGKQILFKEKSVNTLMAVLLLMLAAMPGLLNLAISPFFFFQRSNHLPVFGYALLAGAMASAFSACLIFIGPDDTPQDEEVSGAMALKRQRQLLFLRGCMGGLLPILLLLVFVTPWRSFPVVDTRRGLFADETARAMLTAMKERTWLISNGYLDNHLLIQAFMLNKPLTLITLRPQAFPHDTDRIKRLIASSPVFEGQNRQRLQNALSLGTVRFVKEWFTTDPKAGSRVMVFATPDIWTACGYRAVPEGLAFGGVHPDQKLELTLIEKENREITDRFLPFLLQQNKESGYVAALSEMLRMKAGLVANELGVLLEEMNQVEAAYQAYVRAGEIDPMNISSAINGYALASTQKIHPEVLDRLRKRIKTSTSDRSFQIQGITGILQNYGTIRQQASYRQQAALWASHGSRVVAADKIRKALALSEQTGASALVENASFSVQSGDSGKAEACYLAALEKDASNKGALSGMIMLMLNKRMTLETETWIQKARDAGIEKDALLYETITLAILKKETVQALALLKEATKKYPEDLRYWTLQAELLLNQGDTQMVEQMVLPEMQKALKNPEHFLIHAVRGFLLRKKGPSHFQEARLSLLKALSLNAALPDIWSVVFELDMALGNPTFTETDARNVLNVDPDHALANYLLGSLLLSRGELKESEDFLRRSIEKKPTAAACNDLAENLRLQKRLPEAEKSVRQALELEPELVPALDTLACVLCDANRCAEAAQVAQKVVTAQPKHPAYQLTLLRAQVRLGDKEGVRQRLGTLSEINAVIPDVLQDEIKAMR